MEKYNFGEKENESVWDADTKTYLDLPVWKSPKYEDSKKAAIKFIEEEKILETSDFWILMNRTSNKKKMAYTGLIISHNGCLKINDNLTNDKKFKPSCVKRSENGYNGSLVYEYSNDEQGIFEVGEASIKNCKNDYPYAMAFKRCFDRVVLKICKLAFSGIYSDSESDDFSGKTEEPDIKIKYITEEQKAKLIELKTKLEDVAKYYKVDSIDKVTEEQADEAITMKTRGAK